MSKRVSEPQGPSCGNVLVVDDEERFRSSLSQRLEFRGYRVTAVGDGEAAIQQVRRRAPDVVILDRKMPGMSGEQVLRELKTLAPEVQVVMLTGHASLESATETGRLEAFAYLEKPCDITLLVDTIDAAVCEKQYSLAKADRAPVDSRNLWTWLMGTNNLRPGVLILGAVIFAVLQLIPTPQGLVELLEARKTGDRSSDRIAGFANYTEMRVGESIADSYSRTAHRRVSETTAEGERRERNLTAEEVASAAMVMIGILAVCALFWATGALPIGVTAILVAVLMYLFGVFPPNLVAKSYAKDAVIFILGVLAFSVGVSKTGLDRRIGLVLLGTSKSLTAYLFIFCPLLAVTASFLSEHALIAFIAPLLMVVYLSAIRVAGIKQDRALVVMLMLAVCFAANQGGPGSPAAGGRNAVMIGILSDYGVAPTFGEWVMYGFPFVPVMALVIATYFFFAVRRKTKLSDVNVADIVRKESKRLGKMTRNEWITLAVLALVVVLWCGASGVLGMGGPVLLGLVILAVFRIITWGDINKISWDVVALYGSACAIGVGLSATGAGLWIATVFVDLLPESLAGGEGLCMAASLITAILTNIMSDGATVSAVGPITIPMASVSGTHPWMVGFATAFASSFANCLIIGTPNNAIAFSLARDPKTGEQLLRLSDFLKHGLVVTALSLLVLWGWVIWGYWRWIGF